MELVDTHCHLQFEKLLERQNAVLADAVRANVTKMICVGTTLEDSKVAALLAKKEKNVWAAVGVHPHEAASFLRDKDATKKLTMLAVEYKVVAIGETGLDYYRTHSPKQDQQAALRLHIETGLKVGLPFIFHVRDAWDDFWRIYDSYKNIRGVVHSFSSDSAVLNEATRRGLYVGLNGIMTFTKDPFQLKAASAVPSDRLLLETDAPFLTPAPLRGELCEPRHVRVTAEFLSSLRNESLSELARATTANATSLFGLMT